ncbi:hypothetical protein LWI29_008579 [Acer saccharum]|uniref:Uncharacterized protein n=1 Tax=Acer saccharum TaxID=4024 RepID=A0AA39SRK5_ACESA|nr:hypothetical protein LWI29_008579 [Acer saccharum]
MIEGPKGMFRGSIPRITWYIPASSLTFMAIEFLRDRFNERLENDNTHEVTRFIGQQQSEKERERNRKREIVVAAVAESAALLPSRRHPCLSVPSPLLVDAVFSYRSPPLLLPSFVEAAALARRRRRRHSSTPSSTTGELIGIHPTTVLNKIGF